MSLDVVFGVIIFLILAWLVIRIAWLVIRILGIVLSAIPDIWKILRSPGSTPENELEALAREVDSLSIDAPDEIPRRIAAFREALALIDRSDQPKVWASVQVALGHSLVNNPQGDKTDNIEEAISRCELALEVSTRRDFPEEWADTQLLLALAYDDRIRGNEADNMEEAISHYEQALEFYTKKDFPEEWAMIQNTLAAAYLDHTLAAAYLDHIRGDKARNMEKSISCNKKALEFYTRQDFPEEWAQIQHNLALAYSERIRGDKTDNIEEAISCCELALEVRTRHDFPEKWADTQLLLATVYVGFNRTERAANRADVLEEVISHYEQAIEVYTKKDFPEYWAMIQNALATAYLDRIRGDKAYNIEEAISRHKQALKVYTMEDFPADWAETQNDLAIAYSERIRGNEADNMEEAISRCELALEVRTRHDFPEKWAKIQRTLATAYRDRIRGERAENIEEAISCCELALEVSTRRDFPKEWAETQHNLASAYLLRVRGDRRQNVEETISCFERALKVYTRQDFPQQWAILQNKLAAAYWARVRGGRGRNVEKAISRFEKALGILTPDTLLQNRDTAYHLGFLLYGEGRFAEAREAFTTAHEAVEALRGELVREGSKQRLAEENAGLYARLVHCCLVESDEEAAFEYAVAGKGRAFVDMLATSRFDLSTAGADDPQLGEDLRRARELRQQIDNLLARLLGEGGASPDEDGQQRGSVRSQTEAELRSLQEREAAHWEEMSYRYPTLMATQQAPTLPAEEARRLSEELEATLVEFYCHAGGWCAFVVTPDGVGHVPLPGIDDELADSMAKWFGWIESGVLGLSYEPLRRLHRALIAPLQDYLPARGQIVLAPFSWLHLAPLGAALDRASGRYAAENYTLTFAPNLAALRTAQQGASSAAGQNGEQGLLSVAYPDSPGSRNYLPNVLPEAEAVARHFSRVTPLYEEAATPDAVLSHARGQDVLHLGCHGNFDAASPQQSGLMLSGGRLTVQRIITELHLQETRLATIGACLSGRVHLRQGEEHVGLVQAMMSAGAGAVVASLWSVDDAATRALLEVFYAEVASGDSPAGALADAGTLVRSQPGWEHPYYWAAFQVSGLAHGPYQPGLSNLAEEVAERIEEAHRESMQKRGGLVMEKTAMVKRSMALLEQMGEEPEAVLEALEPTEGREVLARLRELSGQAAGVHTEAELLTLADTVHGLVRERPALAGLLLGPGSDPESQRTVPPPLDQDEAAHDESQSAMDQADYIRNLVVECGDRLERYLPEEGKGSS